MAAKLRYGWLLISIAAACGGKSVRYVEGDDSSTGGEPDPPPAGGRPGAGGTGAAPAGGTFSGGTAAGGGPFTGGTFTGGAFSGGGVSNGGTFPRGGTGATAGTGGTPNLCADLPGLPPREEGIWWDESGVINWSENAFGIQGSWYTADDCSSAPLGLACTLRDPAFIGPDGQPGWETFPNHACVNGIAPQVSYKPDGSFAYSEQWGFLVGFTLNAGDPWNASERCVEGFRFTITGNAPAILRVNVPTTTTQGVAHFYEVPVSGTVAIAFSDLMQGSWVSNRVPLDRSALTALEFHVFTNTSSQTPFSFCVSDVQFLYSLVIP